MPEITTCPECEKKLRVPDDLIGKKVKCPGCGTMFTAQMDRPATRDEEEEDPPPRRPKLSHPEGVREGRGGSSRRDEDEDDEDEAPRRRSRRDEDEEDDDRPRSRRRDEDFEDEESHRRRPRRRDDDDEEDDYDRPRGREMQGWRGVRAGLNLVVISGWLRVVMMGVVVLGGGVVALLAATASRAPAPNPNQPPPGLFAFTGGICALACVVVLFAVSELIIRLIGWGMCMQVPAGPNRPARSLCVAAFCCALGAFLLSFLGGFLQGFNAPAPGAPGAPPNPMAALTGIGGIISLSSNLVTLASFVLWVFFLRAVCQQLRNSSVAGKVMTYFIAELVFIVLSTLLVVVLLAVVGFAAFAAMGPRNPAGAAAGLAGGVIAFFVLLGVIALGYVGLSVWYVLLVTEVRGVVERHIARR